MAGVLRESEVDVIEKESRIPAWLRWTRTSQEILRDTERKLLARIKSSLEGYFVPIFNGTCYLRTLIASRHEGYKAESNNEPIPLVLVHGFASGAALWCKNFDSFATHRMVYAFDVLGFGRSSRPDFPLEAEEVEDKWVESIEDWRKAMSLDKFILLGHSLGGYIVTAYAIKYPERIRHLILADPWGFLEAPLLEKSTLTPAQSWVFHTVRNMLRPFNPLSILRAAGPLGLKLVHHFRQDLRLFFDQRPIKDGDILEIPSAYDEENARRGLSTDFSSSSDSDKGKENSEVDTNNHPVVDTQSHHSNGSDNTKPTIDFDDLDGSVALDYVYHINAQRPSGEVGFKSLCAHVGWPRLPMLHRVHQLDPSVPVTFIYGSQSWMDMSSGLKTRQIRSNSYVDVKIIEGAGHQVYAQMADEFNDYVNAVCKRIDRGDVFSPEEHANEMNEPLPQQQQQQFLDSNNDNSNHKPTKKSRNRMLKKRPFSAKKTAPEDSNPLNPSQHPNSSHKPINNHDASCEDSC